MTDLMTQIAEMQNKEQMYQGFAICRDREGLYAHYYTPQDSCMYLRANKLLGTMEYGVIYNHWLKEPVSEVEIENLSDKVKRELEEY